MASSSSILTRDVTTERSFFEIEMTSVQEDGPFDLDEEIGALSAEREVAEDESKYPTGVKFYLIMISVGLALIMGEMDSSIVSVAIPSITDHFHTMRDVGWYAAAYRLTVCSFQFMFGKLYSLYSLKHILLISVVIFMVGSVMCAAAPTSAAFVAGRAMSGFASAGIISGAFCTLMEVLPLRRRPFWGGIMSNVEGIAVIASPILGGFIVGKLGWRWCFWINVPIGAVTFVFLLTFLKDLKPTETLPWKEKLVQVDLISNAIFVPSLTCLFLALGWAGTRNDWSSPTIIALFVAFIVLLTGFAVMQHRRQDTATLPPRLLRNRSVLSGFIFSFCCNSTIQVVQYYLPTYFQSVRGYTSSQSGIMMLPIIISFLLAMVIQGSAVSLIGYYVPFMLAGSVLLPVFAGLMTTFTVDSSLAKLIFYTGLLGFGAGIGFQAPQTAVQTSLSPADARMGLATIIFAQHFGPAVFISAAQSIFTNRLQANLKGLAPSLNATSIENTSLGELRTHIRVDQLQGLLSRFDLSLVQTWYLAVALGCITMVGSLGMEWRTVKRERFRA
ncbi:putative efflux pump antibiotic resistance protein [Microthyrium microscopicum]|uniref:Putative efflux pump antibiotic resistance protein n=1 Tax=Microthyrium microscopicum TaxID=703497 RepID=A0A6A6U3W9_9PEZI|nr:putative efflux pump antibiotic resistance protein [Microthyrium microscopicum]